MDSIQNACLNVGIFRDSLSKVRRDVKDNNATSLVLLKFAGVHSCKEILKQLVI